MKSYRAVNLAAYEETAGEFESKINLRSKLDQILVNRLAGYFEDQYPSAKILELGPGSGYIAYLLAKRGHQVTAIEFSPKMAEVTKSTAPNIQVITGDFFDYDFGDKKFDVVLGIAFIHLFSAKDAMKVVRKIKNLLEINGVIILSTTLHKHVKEGFIEKVNFKDNTLRFRRRYTQAALEELMTSVGLKVVDFFINKDSEGNAGKTWITLIAKCNPRKGRK